MLRTFAQNLFGNLTRNVVPVCISRTITYNPVPGGHTITVERERCSKWKAWNDYVYSPQTSEERPRHAYVCHVKEHIRCSYKRMWYVACFVRGMSICEALKQLEFVKAKAATVVRETLLEAQKLAVEEHNVEFETNLWVSESFVGKSTYLKSGRRVARGKICTIEHPFVHYFVTLEEGTPPKHYYYHKRPKSAEELLEEWLTEMRQRKVLESL